MRKHLTFCSSCVLRICTGLIILILVLRSETGRAYQFLIVDENSYGNNLQQVLSFSTFDITETIYLTVAQGPANGTLNFAEYHNNPTPDPNNQGNYFLIPDISLTYTPNQNYVSQDLYGGCCGGGFASPTDDICGGSCLVLSDEFFVIQVHTLSNSVNYYIGVFVKVNFRKAAVCKNN